MDQRLERSYAADSAYNTDGRHDSSAAIDGADITLTGFNSSTIYDTTITEQPTDAFPSEVDVEIQTPPAASTSRASYFETFLSLGCMQDVSTRVKNYLNPYLLPDDIDRVLKVDSFLASGTEGVVASAHFRGLKVAVKELFNQSLHNGELLELIAKVKPDNIVHIFGHCPNMCYYVMEFLPGGTLQKYIQNNDTISPGELIKWSGDIANGLTFLHSHNIIHCDIKTDNLVLDANKNLKIIDFGSALVIPADEDEVAIPKSRGTTAFMSKEMVAADYISTATDIWSFAVVIWSMTTLQSPYKEELNQYGQDAVYLGIYKGGYSLHIPDDIPDGIKVLLTMCWNPHPEARPVALFIKKHLGEVERDLNKRTEESYRASQMSWRGNVKVNDPPGQIEEWRREIESHRKLKEKLQKRDMQYKHLLQAYKKLSNGIEPPPLPPATVKRRKTPKKRNTLLNPENRPSLRTYSLPNINLDKVVSSDGKRDESISPSDSTDSQNYVADDEGTGYAADISAAPTPCLPSAAPTPDIVDETLAQDESLANFGVLS